MRLAKAPDVAEGQQWRAELQQLSQGMSRAQSQGVYGSQGLSQGAGAGGRRRPAGGASCQAGAWGRPTHAVQGLTCPSHSAAVQCSGEARWGARGGDDATLRTVQ